MLGSSGSCSCRVFPESAERLTLPRLPAEAADRADEADRAPERRRPRSRPRPTRGAVRAPSRRASSSRVVRQRQDVGDHAQEAAGSASGVKNVPGDDRHRQVDRVDHRRRALGRADEPGDRRGPSRRSTAAPMQRGPRAARAAARAPATEKSSRPSAMISTASIRKTTNVEAEHGEQVGRRRAAASRGSASGRPTRAGRRA